MNLERAVTLFLASYEKQTTRRAYAQGVEMMRDFIGPARPVNSIKPAHLIEFQNEVRSRGLSQSTVNKHIKSVKTFFNWLVSIEELPASPAHAIKLKRMSRAIDRDRAMTDAEYAAVLDYVKWKPRDHALILFLADTGCRAGGAAGLRVDDLDLENRTAHVTEKGDKRRPVWFGDECANAIRRWLLARPAAAGPYVFNRDGQQISGRAVSGVVRNACKRVGVRSLGSHSLRHRKGHQLADAHVAPTVAATALGHENPQTTLESYYPADYDRAREAIQATATKSMNKPENVITLKKGG